MEEKLISAVFKRRAIWDPQDPLRRNSRVLSEFWEEIAHEIQVEVKIAKKRWKNLRAYFVKEIEKLHRPRTHVSVNHVRSSPWSYFTQLYFLNDIVSPSIVNKDSVDSAKNEKSESMTDDETLFPSATCQLDRQLILKNESTTQSTPTTSATNLFSSRDVLRMRKRSRAEMNYPNELGKKNAADLVDGINFEETSDLFFFKSLIPYMDRIPDVRKLKVRSDIQNLILREVESSEQLKRACHFVASSSSVMTPSSTSSSSTGKDSPPTSDAVTCRGTTPIKTESPGIETNEEFVETCDQQSYTFDHDYVETK